MKFCFKWFNLLFISFWFVFNEFLEFLVFLGQELIFLFVKSDLLFIINDFFHKLILKFRLLGSAGLFNFFNLFVKFNNLVLEKWDFLIFLFWNVGNFIFLVSKRNDLFFDLRLFFKNIIDSFLHALSFFIERFGKEFIFLNEFNLLFLIKNFLFSILSL